MGISAQQHRVCTGLFCRYVFNFNRSSSCIDYNIWSCFMSRHVFCACLGIIYFYILLYMMFMTNECSSDVSGAVHPTIHAFPKFSSFMNMYFIITCMHVYMDGFGIKTLTCDLVSKFLKGPFRVKMPLAITPEYLLRLALRITRNCRGRYLSRFFSLNFAAPRNCKMVNFAVISRSKWQISR